MENSPNNIVLLPKNSLRADSALIDAQVTTRSPMGSIIYETGGILIDNGWIRILGSGCESFDRSLMSWNQGKSFEKIGDPPRYLLVADDVLGGFFAINAGGIDSQHIGKVFYFAPDELAWMNMELGYSEFIYFCFQGDLSMFYEGLRWDTWKSDIAGINGDQGVSCFPYLSSAQGKDLNKVDKKTVPIQELWDLHFRNESE